MPVPSLLPHQETVKKFIIDHPYAGVFLDMGMGKTLTTLLSLSEIKPRGNILVIAPLNIVRTTWPAEIDKWGIPVKYQSFIVNDDDRKLSRKERYARYEEAFTESSTMYFINIDLISDLVAFCELKHKKDSSQSPWPFPTVIIDESQSIKNPSASRTNNI